MILLLFASIVMVILKLVGVHGGGFPVLIPFGVWLVFLVIAVILLLIAIIMEVLE